MRRLKYVLTLLGLLLFFVACATPPKEQVTSTAPPEEQVTFTAPPKTDEERTIANTVETMIAAYNEADIEKHVSCYAPDARIDSALAGGFVTRDEYRQILQKRDRLPSIRLKDTKISKVSSDKYQVDTTLVGPRSSASLTYQLVPIEERWLVIEQRYK